MTSEQQQQKNVLKPLITAEQDFGTEEKRSRAADGRKISSYFCYCCL